MQKMKIKPDLITNPKETDLFQPLLKQGIEIRMIGIRIGDYNPKTKEFALHPGRAALEKDVLLPWNRHTDTGERHFYTAATPQLVEEILKPHLRPKEDHEPPWYHNDFLGEEYRPKKHPQYFRVFTGDEFSEDRNFGDACKIYLHCVQDFKKLALEKNLPIHSLQVDLKGNVYDPLNVLNALKRRKVLALHPDMEGRITKKPISAIHYYNTWIRYPNLKSDPDMSPIVLKSRGRIARERYADLGGLYHRILASQNTVVMLKEMLDNKIFEDLYAYEDLEALKRLVFLESKHISPTPYKGKQNQRIQEVWKTDPSNYTREITLERQRIFRNIKANKNGKNDRRFINWLLESNDINSCLESKESLEVQIYRYKETAVWNSKIILAAEDPKIRFEDSLKEIAEAKAKITRPPQVSRLKESEHNLTSAQFSDAKETIHELWLCSNMTLTEESIPINVVIETIQAKYERPELTGKRIAKNLGIL